MGCTFQTPYRSDHSIFCAFARVTACSRRMPVIHASYGASARSSGSTLRI